MNNNLCLGCGRETLTHERGESESLILHELPKENADSNFPLRTQLSHLDRVHRQQNLNSSSHAANHRPNLTAQTALCTWWSHSRTRLRDWHTGPDKQPSNNKVGAGKSHWCKSLPWLARLLIHHQELFTPLHPDGGSVTATMSSVSRN